MSKYTVTLRQGYPFQVRHIAGLVVDASGFKGELTKEQVAEIRADKAYVTIAAVRNRAKKATKPNAKPAAK